MSDSENLEILLIEAENSRVNSYFDELAEHFHVTRVSHSEEVIESAKRLNPVLIILDVDDQGVDRLACCQQLSQTQEIAEVPIIIATLNHSIDERIKGYEAGAFGYLEFPLDLQYIKNKIDKFLTHEEATTQLAADAQAATNTALSAMVGNSELGQAIRFVEKTYAINSFDTLADSLFSVTNALNLKCVVYIKSADDNYFFSSEGSVLPIEAELLQRMHDEAGRFVDLNHRTLIFYPRISILIKNMPQDDTERYGRIKDLLPSMLGAADARIVSIDTEAALTRQTDSVGKTFEQVRDTLNAIAYDYSENQQKNMATMSQMLSELDIHIPGMGLEEDQEEYLLKRINEAVEDAAEIMNNGDKLNSSFKTITTLLNFLSRQQDEILELVKSRKQEQADQAPEDDIEFF
ncbi:MAG: response regulator [Gammaproteobacteria bacterium]|nr:response regulator [Gammaproteobacteria bacterium]